MLSATSTTDAPWYIIPADKKWFTRACVADIIVSRIAKLDLKYPMLSDKERAALRKPSSNCWPNSPVVGTPADRSSRWNRCTPSIAQGMRLKKNL